MSPDIAKRLPTVEGAQDSPCSGGSSSSLRIKAITLSLSHRNRGQEIGSGVRTSGSGIHAGLNVSLQLSLLGFKMEAERRWSEGSSPLESGFPSDVEMFPRVEILKWWVSEARIAAPYSTWPLVHELIEMAPWCEPLEWTVSGRQEQLVHPLIFGPANWPSSYSIMLYQYTPHTGASRGLKSNKQYAKASLYSKRAEN